MKVRGAPAGKAAKMVARQLHVWGGEPTRSEAHAELERNTEVDLEADQELKSWDDPRTNEYTRARPLPPLHTAQNAQACPSKWCSTGFEETAPVWGGWKARSKAMRHRSGQRQGYERTTARSQGREPGDSPGVRAKAADQCLHRPPHPLLMRLAELSLDSRPYEMRDEQRQGWGQGEVKVKGKTEAKRPVEVSRGIRGDSACTRNESRRPVRGGDGARDPGRKRGICRIMPARGDSPDIAAGGNHDPALGDLGLDSQGFTCARGKHRPVRNGRGACGSREESRPEAVVPKIREVHKRETAVPPLFFSGCRGGREDPGWGEEPEIRALDSGRWLDLLLHDSARSTMRGYGWHPACIPPRGGVSALASPWKRAGATWRRSGASRWTDNLQEQGVLADREGVCRKGLTSVPASCREYECTAEAHTGGVEDVKQIRGVVQQAGGRMEHRARFHCAAQKVRLKIDKLGSKTSPVATPALHEGCEKLRVAGIVSGDPAGRGGHRWRGERATAGKALGMHRSARHGIALETVAVGEEAVELV
ncbi:hypothetical protein B0H13DRAFT_2280654 [Mycena leptocephala]|nr:hypothetical protein B0H13DRAFT_2280654 [Mycena leptocephala]